LGILDVTFLNNFQVVIKGLKGDQKEFVTISQRLVLIGDGSDFLLEGLKSCRLSIIGGDRGFSGNSLDRRRGIFFFPGIVKRGGGLQNGLG